MLNKHLTTYAHALACLLVNSMSYTLYIHWCCGNCNYIAVFNDTSLSDFYSIIVDISLCIITHLISCVHHGTYILMHNCPSTLSTHVYTYVHVLYSQILFMSTCIQCTHVRTYSSTYNYSKTHTVPVCTEPCMHTMHTTALVVQVL